MNDNAPVFVSDIINIEINENTRSAYSLDNQMAYDPDIGKISKKLNFLSKCQKYSERVKNTEDTSQKVVRGTKQYFLHITKLVRISRKWHIRFDLTRFRPQYDRDMTPDMISKVSLNVKSFRFAIFPLIYQLKYVLL